MGPQSVASSSVPASGATNVLGGGSTTPSVHRSSKSPFPSSPNIFGCLMQPPPLSLQSRWPPKAKSSQNLFFGQELGILRRKNDNLEKEAKKLRYQVAHLQDELEKEKKNAQNVMKRRENRMKDMQTQTEEEIKVRFRLYLRYLYIFSILS